MFIASLPARAARELEEDAPWTHHHDAHQGISNIMRNRDRTFGDYHSPSVMGDENRIPLNLPTLLTKAVSGPEIPTLGGSCKSDEPVRQNIRQGNAWVSDG